MIVIATIIVTLFNDTRLGIFPINIPMLYLFRALIYMGRAVEIDYIEVWLVPSRDQWDSGIFPVLSGASSIICPLP